MGTKLQAGEKGLEESVDGIFDDIELLAGSRIRIELLLQLSREDTLEKDEVQTRFDASRTTLQRNLKALNEQGWIQEEYPHYMITPSGRAVAEQFREFAESMRAIQKLQPVVRWLPEFDGLDFQNLAEGDVIITTQSNPYAPVNRHIELMQEVTHFRCMLPAIGLPALRVARDNVVENDQMLETIVGTNVAQTIRSDGTYTDLCQEIIGNNSSRYLEYDGEVPYYLGIADHVIQIGVGDAEGKPEALVETENEKARKWAVDTYSMYRQNTEPLF